jgi:hypothetical protein
VTAVTNPRFCRQAPARPTLDRQRHCQLGPVFFTLPTALPTGQILSAAAADGSVDDVSIALQMVLQLEHVEYRRPRGVELTPVTVRNQARHAKDPYASTRQRRR